MKIVVIGGSGLIGSLLVDKLGAHGHEVVAASPRTGVDTLTGEGLSEALEGASVVVDVSNSPSSDDAAVLEFFETTTHNLLVAESSSGVAHHVALSVVGTEHLTQSGYFRAKSAQEGAIVAGSIPSSIVQATQFFEFLGRIADDSTEGDSVRVAPVMVQPMAAEDVAAAVGRIAVGPPVDGVVEIAGPERFRLDDLIGRVLAARDDPRTVVSDPAARYFGAELRERSLLPGASATLSETTLADWLSHRDSGSSSGEVRPEILFRDDLEGDIVAIDDHTWAIHGNIPFDRDVIIAEFDRPEEAEEVLASLKPDQPESEPRTDPWEEEP